MQALRIIFTFLFLLLALFFGMTIPGCSSSTGTGAVAGAAGLGALQRLADDADRITDRELVLLAGQKLELEEQRADALTSDKESLAVELQEAIAEKDMQIERAEAIDHGVDLAKQAAGRDWTDAGQEASPWLASAIMTGLWYWQRRGKVSTAETLRAYKLNLDDLYKGKTAEQADEIRQVMGQHR